MRDAPLKTCLGRRMGAKTSWYTEQGIVEGRDFLWTGELDGLDATKVDEIIKKVTVRLGLT
jgi:hypothetical protein